PPPGRSGELSLVALLPALRRHLGLTAELHVVKAPARYSWGVPRWGGKLRGCQPPPPQGSELPHPAGIVLAFAITVGVPAEAEGEIRTGLCWQRQGDTAVVRRCRGAGGAGASPHPVYPCLPLLQSHRSPRASPAFPEQLPVHLTLLLCPALGDHEHSSRVGRVLGVPFLLPPEAAPTRTQVLDEELLSRLGLSPQQLRHLPLHLHLQQLVLP
ncbi:RUSD3 synthase, partial [Ibidorhyncha struthersii]|nr:RUSD3 synthase [Ibidorhyncha struthersii]